MRPTLLMTAALAALMSMPAAAQQRGQGPGRAMQPATVDEMTSRLSLTAEQAGQVATLRSDFLSATAPQRELMQQMQAARQAGAPADSMRAMRERMQPQMQELRSHTERYEAEVAKVLTAEQRTQWQAWQKERRGMGRRGGADRPAPPRQGG